MMYLLRDIRSSLRNSQLYGSTGDEVKIISESGDVWIVENSNGNRFAVHKKWLSDNIPNDIPKISSKPVATVNTEIKHKQKASSLQTQKPLF